MFYDTHMVMSAVGAKDEEMTMKILKSLRDYVRSGTHDPEPTAPILGLCNGIFTDRSIFRLSFLEKTKAVPVR